MLLVLCAAIAIFSHQDATLAGQLVDVSSIEVVGPGDGRFSFGVAQFMGHMESHVEKLSGISNWIGETLNRRFALSLSLTCVCS